MTLNKQLKNGFLLYIQLHGGNSFRRIKLGKKLKLIELTQIVKEKYQSGNRLLIAIAGPPGAGKTTLAAGLKNRLIQDLPASNPAILSMDGFHLDNEILDQLELREVKGAPETFDAHGFLQLVRRVRQGDLKISIPDFDRTLDQVIPDHHVITISNEIIIIEGNYLFLEEDPWLDLIDLIDLPIFLLPKTDLLERRLIERWLSHGFDEHSARLKAYSNDIPNAKLVLANSGYIDLTIESVDLEN